MDSECDIGEKYFFGEKKDEKNKENRIKKALKTGELRFKNVI